MTEHWLPLTHFTDYEISDQGRIRSLGRYRDNRHGTQTWWESRILKPTAHPSGHLWVCLTREKKQFSVRVHPLVLEAFVSARPEGMWALHRNGNPADNRADNLYWGTPADNAQDRVRHGTDAHARQVKCKHGHDNWGTRTYRDSGGRFCITCARNRAAVSNAKRKAARLQP